MLNVKTVLINDFDNWIISQDIHHITIKYFNSYRTVFYVSNILVQHFYIHQSTTINSFESYMDTRWSCFFESLVIPSHITFFSIHNNSFYVYTYVQVHPHTFLVCPFQSVNPFF